MKRCPKCGNQFPDEANFCPADAGRLVPDEGPGPGSGPTDGRVGKRFALGDRIGGGWTGEVYRANDTTTGQDCAVKLVDPKVFPSPLMLQRTERELTQLERLDASGVAKVIAHGKDGAQLWIASELLEGKSLHELVSQHGPAPLPRASEYVLAIGRALGEAAKAGVVHRDLSPKNVLIVGEEVKLINFGVPVPGIGEAQGVPEYVSPEQVDGKPVDQRSSIYSLGAIYYFLLTGRPPFAGDAQTVLEQVRSSVPAPPSSLAQVPPAVDELVLKALEKSSSKRFMTLRQLLEQVESASEDTGGTQPMGRAGGKRKKEMGKTIPGGFVGLSAEGTAEPAPAPVAAAPVAVASTPASAPQPQGGNGSSAPVAHNPTPAPALQPASLQAAPAAAPQPAAAAPASGKGKGKSKSKSRGSRGKSKGKFRETMWFKKGELDAAAAQQAASSSKKGDLVSDRADELPIEDRYNDDGTLRAEDQKFSLRTGHTQAMQAMRDSVPRSASSSDVSDDELIGEMKAGRGKIIALILLGVVVLVGIVFFFATR